MLKLFLSSLVVMFIGWSVYLFSTANPPSPTVVIVKSTPSPAPIHGAYQYVDVYSIKEVNIYCADKRYGWKVKSTANDSHGTTTYTLERYVP